MSPLTPLSDCVAWGAQGACERGDAPRERQAGGERDNLVLILAFDT